MEWLKNYLEINHSHLTQLFESLSRQVDPEKAAAQDKEAEERLNAQAQRAQARLSELVCLYGMAEEAGLIWCEKIGTNSTLPVTINSINLIGGRNTRRSFLDRLFDPLLSANQDRPYNLSEALHKVSSVATTLQRFGIHSRF